MSQTAVTTDLNVLNSEWVRAEKAMKDSMGLEVVSCEVILPIHTHSTLVASEPEADLLSKKLKISYTNEV